MGDAGWDEVLRARGCRVTAQRIAILTALADMKHPTAESLHERLRAAEPGLNLSTVYRTLAMLQDAGLVTHAHIGGTAPVYHFADEPAHIHLSCLGCGRIDSIQPGIASEFADGVAAQTGFVIDAGHSAVYGWCRECARH